MFHDIASLYPLYPIIANGNWSVKKRKTENALVAVALVDNEEATVKRFFKEQGRIRLQPENDAMEPIYADNVSIAGKVIGLIRTM